MGRKKSMEKSKELSAVMAEASSAEKEGHHQAQTSRKRGRPRKNVEKTESKEKSQPKEDEQGDAKEAESKSMKSSEGEVQLKETEPPPTASGDVKKEEEGSTRSLRSRGKRKSQPRKSS